MSRPSKFWYWFGGAMIFASAPVFIYFLVTTILEVTSASHRFAAPGSSVMTIEEPGPYMISHEFVSDFQGGRYRTENADLSSLSVSVTQESSGRRLKVAETRFDTSYQLGSREGMGILTINVPDPGEYSIEATFAEEADEIVLAIEPDPVGTIFKGLGLAFALPPLLILIGSVIIIITYLRRRASKKTMSTDDSKYVAEFRGTDYK